MTQYQKILLVVDSQFRRTPAVLRASQLAQSSGAALHMVLIAKDRTIAALERFGENANGGARGALLEFYGQRMAELRRFAEQMARHVTTDMIYDDHPQRALADYVKEMKPDLVVKDVQHETRLSRLLLTPADWSLIRATSSPVLLVNSASAGIPRRVIAAVDANYDQHTDASDLVVAAAEALAIQCDAELELVHVLEIAMPLASGAPELDMGLSAGMYKVISDNDQRWFTEYAERRSVPLEHRHLLSGHAPDALSAFAAHAGTDVLVMGSKQRGTLDRALLGSTTEDTLTKARCDVLVIPCGVAVH